MKKRWKYVKIGGNLKKIGGNMKKDLKRMQKNSSAI